MSPAKKRRRIARPKTAAIKVNPNELRDPLLYLNVDIMNMIFQYLSMTDILNCDGLSQGWQSFVQGWTEKFRLKVFQELRPFWHRYASANSLNNITYSEIKEQCEPFFPQ